MPVLFSIFQREFRAYFITPVATIYLILLWGITSLFFFHSFFVVGQASIAAVTATVSWLFLLFIPALSMTTWSEDRKTGLYNLWFSLPVTKAQWILGKFCAQSSLLALGVIGLFPLCMTAAWFGNPDWGVMIMGLTGIWILGTCFLAIGCVASFSTENQIIAYLLGVLGCFFFWISGTPFVVDRCPEILASALTQLSLASHYDSWIRGVLDSRDLVYFGSFILIWLWINYQLLIRTGEKPMRSSVSILLVLSIALITVLSEIWPLQKDLTSGKIHTLSPQSQELLRQLNQSVTITAYFSKNLPPTLHHIRKQLRDTLTEFHDKGNGKIQIRYIDPAESPATLLKIQQLGIPKITFNIVAHGQPQTLEGFMGMAITCQDKTDILPVIQDLSNLDYTLTRMIQKLTLPQPVQIGLLIPAEITGTFQYLKSDLLKGYTVIMVKEPEDLTNVAVAVVINPVNLAPRLVRSLDQYLVNGGRILVLANTVIVNQALQGVPVKTGLENWLNTYGLAIEPSVVLDENAAYAGFNTGYSTFTVAYPFWPRILFENTNSNLPLFSGLESVVLPWTSRLRFTRSLPNITPQSLAFSSAHSSVLNQHYDFMPKKEFRIKSSLARQLVIAGLSGQFPGQFSNPGTNRKPGKLIVLGSSYVITDATVQQYPGNLTFIQNTIDWLNTEPTAHSLRARMTTDHPLRLSNILEKKIWQVAGSTASPAMLLFVWITLRSRRRQKAAEH